MGVLLKSKKTGLFLGLSCLECVRAKACAQWLRARQKSIESSISIPDEESTERRITLSSFPQPLQAILPTERPTIMCTDYGEECSTPLWRLSRGGVLSSYLVMNGKVSGNARVFMVIRQHRVSKMTNVILLGVHGPEGFPHNGNRDPAGQYPPHHKSGEAITAPRDDAGLMP